MMRKECLCGRRYDDESWSRLPFAGFQSKGTDRDSAVFEMRTCVCGSSLVVEPDEVVRQIARVSRRVDPGLFGR